MTQNDMVLQYMKDNGSITPLEALAELGCMRLASRISDLRLRGIKIISNNETHINRYGKKVSYARYRLAKENH